MHARTCVFAVVTAFLLGIASFAAAQPLDRKAFVRIAKELGPSVVRLSVIKVKGDEVRDLKSTGFVVQGGYIMTSHHVIKGALEIIVTMPDGHEFSAHVEAEEEKADLAILTLEPNDEQNLPLLIPVRLGDESQLEVGDFIVVIGNPLDIGISIAVGTISALDRPIAHEPVNMIQTDAAVNFGNSGGPLVNLDGEVVGVVTSFAVGMGMSGIGWAVPIHYAKELLDRNAKEPKVPNPSSPDAVPDFGP